MNERLNDLAADAGLTWFDYQVETLEAAMADTDAQKRACLYYKTGAGKSFTSLGCMAVWDVKDVLVIAPPATHNQWVAAGARFGIDVETMSHAKFRAKDTKLSRHKAIIADEMHLFGGHGGQGWKKLDRLAGGMVAPLVLASATPNYNDADRVYCIQHILDPASCRGGFLEFIYAHCVTEQNPFGQMPKVLGFQRYGNAAEYLAALPKVHYLPDDLVYQIVDMEYPEEMAWPMEVYGYNERDHRIIASQIEERHTRRYQGLVDSNGFIHDHVFEILEDLVESATTPLLVYANHATVAEALAESLTEASVSYGLVTGKTSKKEKDLQIDVFKDGGTRVLVGTASLATGTDGLDKMCDWLVILDDTDDDSLRRQLIGRIMPRGADTDASSKHVYRLVPS